MDFQATFVDRVVFFCAGMVAACTLVSVFVLY
jgi:hypothetical protein